MTYRTCQWIDDEIATASSCKCGAETVPGRSWCAEHMTVVFRTDQPGAVRDIEDPRRTNWMGLRRISSGVATDAHDVLPPG